MRTRIVALIFVALAVLAFFLSLRREERRAVVLRGSPRRIVTASPALCECLYAIGAGERLVGVSRFCRNPEEARSLAQIGGMVDPNLVAIEGLAPDCILVQQASPRLESFASERGIATERFTIETIQDVLAVLERLGALTDHREGAAREVARLTSALAAARAAAPRPGPRVLLVYFHDPGELREVCCAGKDTFLIECLEAAGGETAFPDVRGYPPLSREAILERDPDAILELRPEETPPEVEGALRRDWELAFHDLKAVKTNRVLVVSDDAALVPGPRIDRVVARIARALGSAR